MIETVRQAKEVWIAIAVIVAGTVTVLTYLGLNFQTADAAETSHKDIISQMTAVHEEQARVSAQQAREMASIRELLELKIQQDKLDAVNRDLTAINTEMFNVSQWMKANGEDNNSLKRMKELEQDKDALQIKRGCIISGNKVCR